MSNICQRGVRGVSEAVNPSYTKDLSQIDWAIFRKIVVENVCGVGRQIGRTLDLNLLTI